MTRGSFGRVATIAIAVFLPLQAMASEVWQTALSRCIGPFEQIRHGDTEGLKKVQAPDWAQAPDEAETFLAAPGVYLSLTGDIDVESATCTVAARGEGLAPGFLAWAKETHLIGIYGPVSGDDLTHLESVDWREPKVNIEYVVKDGVTWIKSYETDEEA